jgi:hypothetical protein
MASLPAVPVHTDDLHRCTTPHIIPAASIVGSVVFTRDGKRLGRVKEATAECLLIDVRFAFDYWLSSRAIVQVAAGQVHLGIDKQQVGAYLVDRDCLEDFTSLPSVTTRPVVLHAAS